MSRGSYKSWNSRPAPGAATELPSVVKLASGPDPGTRFDRIRDGERLLVHYSRPRVWLDRDAWEALKDPNDVLVQRVRYAHQQVYTIALTQTELENVFGSVRETRSWQYPRCYHFPVAPYAAGAFRVVPATTFSVARDIDLRREPDPPREPHAPRVVRAPNVSRETFGKILGELLAEYGSLPIPSAVLDERGLAPSAGKHPPYWGSTNPGGRALFDLGLRGTLRRGSEGYYLVLQAGDASQPPEPVPPSHVSVAAPVAPAPVAARAPLVEPAVPRGPIRDWLDAIESSEHRHVLAHVAVHGSITEAEVADIVGGASRARRFAANLDALVAAGAPMRVRVASVGGMKRYVRENE